MQLATTSASSAHAVAPALMREASRGLGTIPGAIPGTKVVPRDTVGTVTGRWGAGTGLGGSHVGTEFGRGHMGRSIGLLATHGNELFYEAPDHAVRAASILSSGTFLGAVSLSSSNFVGVALRKVGVEHAMGGGGVPVSYEFESLAQTATGRRQLEQTLKLGLDDWAVIDGEWAAVREDGAGNVRVLATKDYVRELRGDAPSA